MLQDDVPHDSRIGNGGKAVFERDFHHETVDFPWIQSQIVFQCSVIFPESGGCRGKIPSGQCGGGHNPVRRLFRKGESAGDRLPVGDQAAAGSEQFHAFDSDLLRKSRVSEKVFAENGSHGAP